MPKRLLNRWQASDDENCHDDHQGAIAHHHHPKKIEAEENHDHHDHNHH